MAKGNAKFHAWLTTDTKGAAIGAAANLAEIVKMAPIPFMDGLEFAAANLSARGIRAVATGEEATMATLHGKALAVADMARGELETMKSQMSGPDVPAAFGAMQIVQYHMAQNALDQVKPKLDGNRLSVSLDIKMGDPMFMVAIVGVLSAVAIPAFMKYIKKSKTSEARQFVKKLYDGGRKLSLEQGGQLPPSAGPTPPLGSCCAGAAEGKCMPNPALWENPTWTALQFSVDDPHYYSYEWQTDGKEFKVRAYGDLDCDGIYSTFEIYGATGPNGPEPMPPIFREMELE
jgi:type IV pilus assembly protein PilA